MRFLLFSSLLLFLLFSCRKKKPTETEQATQPALAVQLSSYDSLGEPRSDHSGFTVKLPGANQTKVSEAGGLVIFNNLKSGKYTPEVSRTGYESVQLQATVLTTTAQLNVPVAQRSTLVIKNLVGEAVNRDSVTLSFNFDRPLPQGKTCKLAIFTGTTITLNASNYLALDMTSVASTTVTNLNVAKLPNFKTLVSKLDSNAFFFVGAVAVSYGAWQPSPATKAIMLGDNTLYPGNVTYKKNWKQ